MKTSRIKRIIYSVTAYATLLAALAGVLFFLLVSITPLLSPPPPFSIPDSKAKVSTRYFSVPNVNNPPCLRLELAQTQEQRVMGLSYRTALPENSGMLFVFPQVVQESFIMTNVSIPLSIAFLNEHGVIQEIHNMSPSSAEVTLPKLPYRFAIEVNQGWFDRYQIKAGNAFQACIPRS